MKLAFPAASDKEKDPGRNTPGLFVSGRIKTMKPFLTTEKAFPGV